MDNNAINCEIVKDLIPLYSEGLCSETGRAAVESHIAGCESCRKLLNTPIEQKQPVPVPPEKNVFKKLSRRLKMNMAVMIVLGVVLLAVLGVVGYLSVGQIVKGHEMVSFETISQSIEAKKVARLIADRDFRGYLDATYCDNLMSKFWSGEYEKIQEHNAEQLAKAYNDVVGSRKVRSISAHSEYSTFDQPGRYTVYTICTLEYDDGAGMEIHFIKGSDNRLAGDAVGSHGLDREKFDALSGGFLMINNGDEANKRLVEKVILSNPESEEDIEGRSGFISNSFDAKCRDTISAALSEFYKKGVKNGYTITDCTIGDDMFDEEFNRYFNIWITARDGSGTAVYKGRVYRQWEGFLPPQEVTVYSDGCTDELTESLAKMFG